MIHLLNCMSCNYRIGNFIDSLYTIIKCSRGSYSTNANVKLVKNISIKRTEWENLRKKDSDKLPDKRSDQYGYHSGFGKPLSSKSKVGMKYIGKLQNITKNMKDVELLDLFAEISRHIDDFTPYELIDIGYYLTRVNKEGCSEVVEPILHRFFSLPERYSCLNGIYIHRLLRTMFIFQDVTYRVWVYDIAQVVGSKHQHLLMRDVQLIIDDLSLFYDAAAQGSLISFEQSVIERANQLELYRLPLVVHALGRCGYNSSEVAKAIHNVYLNKKGHPDYYLSQLIGLLLKGYCSFHFHPGFEFLDDVWIHIKDQLRVIEFKYISWIGESFLRLRYLTHISVILDELISKYKLLSHLEFTDFITNCWSIQSHLLRLEFNRYITIHEDFLPRIEDINNDKELTERLYEYYKKLMRLILQEMPDKVYKSTPPYRATQFELLTRLLVIYPNPRDFRFLIPLRKHDMAYPLVEKGGQAPKEGEINYIFTTYNDFSKSIIFKHGHLNEEDCSLQDNFMNSVVLDHQPDDMKLEPLCDLLKQYVHSLFFRTPALAPRGLRLLIQGLVRIHFEERENCVIDPDLLPEMKAKYYSRPLSKAIIREVYRKLACYNTDDLIISLFGMIVLRMFELDLAKELLLQTTDMWLHYKNENQLLDGQLYLIKLFYKTINTNLPSLYNSLDSESINSLIN